MTDIQLNPMKSFLIPFTSMKKTVILLGGLGFGCSTLAAPLSFSQYPAGSASKEPAPNVIVSVDDSGSMSNYDDNDETRITSLKKALRETFSEANIPDNRIRLAWQSINRCDSIPDSGDACDKKNSMKPLTATHRNNFLTWVDTLYASGGTPLHTVMRSAGEYLKLTGKNSPWNAIPGTSDLNPLACRRAYHILMTDGEWNNYKNGYDIGNADGTSRTLPDGARYDINSDQTVIYRDSWGDSTGDKLASTLSDMAFYYWATDLQPAIINSVRPLIKKPGAEVFTSDTNKSKTILEYWNPKNDPATWQHMTTYTIGYGDAGNWGGNNPRYVQSEGMYGGDFSNVINGKKWIDPFINTSDNERENARKAELWHIPINSRGKFFPAKTPQDLKNAFQDIVNTIIEDTSTPITSFASASTSISNQGTAIYISSYLADGWTGNISSKTVAAGTGALADNPAWGTRTVAPIRGKTTADILDERSDDDIGDRLILTFNDELGYGVELKWEGKKQVGGLSSKQQNLLKNGGSTDLGQERLHFIRGKRNKEGDPLRVRKSRQGDIVNSSIWYTGRPVNGYTFDGYRAFATKHQYRIPMLYVGGNDGMLHGFSALDGTEKIAYTPQGVIENLHELANPSYSHRYYVDGSPFTGDVNLGTSAAPDWRTMLVGTLGAGGKGYFVLDVTRPGYTAGTETSNFTADNAKTIVVMDKTDGTDPDIGSIFGDPVTAEFNPQIATQITRMNNGRWAAVLGNGYNSTNERPVLLIQYLDGDESPKKLIKIPVASSGAEATGNGLSTPRLVDLDGDGTPDVVYAGDLRGNVWKFDVSSASDSKWKVAFSPAGCPSPTSPACTPFYTAVAKANNTTRQPITAAPNVRPATTVQGLMVAFGTGRNVTDADRTDTSAQTFYALLDNTRYKKDTTAGNLGKLVEDTAAVEPKALGTGLRDKLAERKFTGTAIAGAGDSINNNFWRMENSQPALSYQGANPQKGWYFELPVAGERVLKTPKFFDGSDVLDIFSTVPASGGSTVGESCEPSSTQEQGYRTLLGIEFGKRPTQQLLDANGDGVFNSADNGDYNTNRRTIASAGIELNARGQKIRIDKNSATKTKATSKPAAILSWRQLQ